MAQAYALKLDILGELEAFERTETWGFRYASVIGRLRSKNFECGMPVTVDEKLHISCYFGANKR